MSFNKNDCDRINISLKENKSLISQLDLKDLDFAFMFDHNSFKNKALKSRN